MFEIGEIFNLKVGEMYAILPDNSTVHIGGTYLGPANIGQTDGAWLAFNTATEDDPRIRFFNPQHIRSLLPESDPRL